MESGIGGAAYGDRVASELSQLRDALDDLRRRPIPLDVDTIRHVVTASLAEASAPPPNLLVTAIRRLDRLDARLESIEAALGAPSALLRGGPQIAAGRGRAPAVIAPTPAPTPAPTQNVAPPDPEAIAEALARRLAGVLSSSEPAAPRGRPATLEDLLAALRPLVPDAARSVLRRAGREPSPQAVQVLQQTALHALEEAVGSLDPLAAPPPGLADPRRFTTPPALAPGPPDPGPAPAPAPVAPPLDVDRLASAVAGRVSEAVAGRMSAAVAGPVVEVVARQVAEAVAGQMSVTLAGQVAEAVAGQVAESIAGQVTQALAGPVAEAVAAAIPPPPPVEKVEQVEKVEKPVLRPEPPPPAAPPVDPVVVADAVITRLAEQPPPQAVVSPMAMAPLLSAVGNVESAVARLGEPDRGVVLAVDRLEAGIEALAKALEEDRSTQADELRRGFAGVHELVRTELDAQIRSGAVPDDRRWPASEGDGPAEAAADEAGASRARPGPDAAALGGIHRRLDRLTRQLEPLGGVDLVAALPQLSAQGERLERSLGNILAALATLAEHLHEQAAVWQSGFDELGAAIRTHPSATGQADEGPGPGALVDVARQVNDLVAGTAADRQRFQRLGGTIDGLAQLIGQVSERLDRLPRVLQSQERAGPDPGPGPHATGGGLGSSDPADDDAATDAVDAELADVADLDPDPGHAAADVDVDAGVVTGDPGPGWIASVEDPAPLPAEDGATEASEAAGPGPEELDGAQDADPGLGVVGRSDVLVEWPPAQQDPEIAAAAASMAETSSSDEWHESDDAGDGVETRRSGAEGGRTRRRRRRKARRGNGKP